MGWDGVNTHSCSSLILELPHHMCRVQLLGILGYGFCLRIHQDMLTRLPRRPRTQQKLEETY